MSAEQDIRCPSAGKNLSAYREYLLSAFMLADRDGLNARQVCDLSHEEAGWRLVEDGDVIPYEAALGGARQVSTPTSLRLQREVAGRRGLLPA